MKKLLAIFFLISTFMVSLAAIPEDTTLTKIKQKPRFVFSFDGRTSVIMNNKAKIGGMKFGLEFGKMRYGIGFYGLETPIYVEEKINKSDDKVVPAKVKFGYISPYAEYVFYQSKRWEFSIPVQLGFGDTHLEYFDSTAGKNKIDKRITVALLEASVVGHYKFCSWLGLGAGWGFRKMITTRPIIQKAFDSPVFIFKIKIFVGVIYRKVFPKKENRKNQ